MNPSTKISIIKQVMQTLQYFLLIKIMNTIAATNCKVIDRVIGLNDGTRQNTDAF